MAVPVNKNSKSSDLASTHDLLPSNSTTLAVVPARGGSKGIPGKNVALVAGLPLIVHTLRSAAAARRIDRLIVSTDAEPIAQVARAAGAEVPFLRPAELARDDTPGCAPVIHALEWLEEQEGYRPDYVLLLQPTSPLRSGADIDAAIALAQSRNAERVVSVTAAATHPFWIKRVDADGALVPFCPDEVPSRRQDLPPAYALNGAIYLARAATLRAGGSFSGSGTLAYVMPVERSLDIDTPWDLKLADLILSQREVRS